jgi:hypothetical protein
MSVQSHLLIDANHCVVRGGETYRSDGASRWQVRLRTCRGGRSEGVQVVELSNGAISIDVLPSRGMGIWRVRRGENTLGWHAPARHPVHPAFVPLMEPAGLGWLDGFNELLCRCGLESSGPPEFDDRGRLVRPLHGRIANTPAHRVALTVDEGAGRITLQGVIDETRFHFQSLRLTSTLTSAIGSTEFTWTDEVQNIGGRDATLQMLYHFNLGQPLLRAGAQIVAPIRALAPLTQVAAREGVDTWNIVPPPRPGSAEQVYCLDLAADDAGDTRVLVSGLTDYEAVSLRFNKRTLPCFTVWRNTPAEADGYVLGIEPGTNYPNPRTFEMQHGRAVALKPGETWRTEISAAWHTRSEAIAEEQNAIRSIQSRVEPEISTTPRADWSANP